MNTPLALLNLAHHRWQTLGALAGVGFAVLLLFMQLGFLGAVEDTATLIYGGLKFDLLLRSPRYLHFADPRSFPRARLALAAASSDVLETRALHAGLNRWRHPKTGLKRVILLLGVEPGADVFFNDELAEKSALLTRPELALVDRLSRREFGPGNGERFSDADLGVETELGGKRVRVAGHFAQGAGLAADGAVVLGDRGFLRVQVGQPADEVCFGLVKLRPGADPDAAAAFLRNKLPPDVDVLTRADALRWETNRWIWGTAVGVIFVSGVVLALMVGAAIVVQVLSSDVSRHLSEYATLKAMGYTNRYLTGVVLQQAAWLTLGGYAAGGLLALALYRVTSATANVSVRMTGGRALLVLLLTALMCAASGWLALRKAQRADPAELF